MNYPQMGRNRKYTLNIPDFSGGINASKPMQDIQDNQAAMIKNMWLKDGVLQTRPAMRHGGNAYFLSIFGLKDLGVEIKLGYETYNADNTAQGDAQQRTYRLFYSGTKEFLLFDVENKSFTNVELDFQKSLYEACFSEGDVEYEFFYSNGISSSQLSLESGYMQTFCSEVYGYLKLSGCLSLTDSNTDDTTVEVEEQGSSELEDGDIIVEENSSSEESTSEAVSKSIVLLCYLKPYVDEEDVSNKVKLKLQIFNSVKDLPTEHVPYCPTVLLDYGESYAETLDDFNLMSGSFMIDYNTNKSLTQFPSDEIVNWQSYVDKGLADGSEKYGNFNA